MMEILAGGHLCRISARREGHGERKRAAVLDAATPVTRFRQIMLFPAEKFFKELLDPSALLLRFLSRVGLRSRLAWGSPVVMPGLVIAIGRSPVWLAVRLLSCILAGRLLRLVPVVIPVSGSILGIMPCLLCLRLSLFLSVFSLWARPSVIPSLPLVLRSLISTFSFRAVMVILVERLSLPVRCMLMILV